MGYKDFPKVDKASINSQYSEQAVERLFSKENGFISRKDNPDMGCDYDIELILNQTDAYNWRIGVQIKSMEKLQLIRNKTMISYSFESSRLNYLVNRPIGDGLVIIYDNLSGNCYYDYAQHIFKRLMDERASDNWLKNKKVSIQVPITNLLDENSLKTIHQNFTDKFQKALLILQSQGPRYNYPVVKHDTMTLDLKNPEQVKEFLLKEGIEIIYRYDLQSIYLMINSLPPRTFQNSANLIAIAATVYGLIGMRYESMHFIRKLEKYDVLPEIYRHELALVKLSNQLAFGEIGIDVFIEGLKKIQQKATDQSEQICLDISIVNCQLYASWIFRPILHHPFRGILHQSFRAKVHQFLFEVE